ncbi:MAG: hypothetical protein IJ424_07625 [Oscillospiraceae bacterium]|nr:hypothetical protein [Oscillospiraceae bacterium]
MTEKWIVQKSKNDYTFLLLEFLLEEYCRIFGFDIMHNEYCVVFNDPKPKCPMIITNTKPIVIRLSQDDLSFWSQTIFQLSHELCHYAMRQRKIDKDFTLSWFEEIVCEAVSLYALEYASKNWHKCQLSANRPTFFQNHKSYLDGELLKDYTDVFKQCNTVEKLRAYELQELPESQRETHRLERNIIYRAISTNPVELKCILDYTKYIEINGVTIDFDKWFQDNPCNLIKELKAIQPVVLESTFL